MYNLLMWGASGYWEEGPATIEFGRYLEYTNDPLKARLTPVIDEVVVELRSYPALFAYEEPNEAPAKVGWITDIQRRQAQLRITFSWESSIEPISPAQMKKLYRALDIDGKLEVHRSHWAVKEVDLFEVLGSAGLLKAMKVAQATFKFLATDGARGL